MAGGGSSAISAVESEVTKVLQAIGLLESVDTSRLGEQTATRVRRALEQLDYTTKKMTRRLVGMETDED